MPRQNFMDRKVRTDIYITNRQMLFLSETGYELSAMVRSMLNQLMMQDAAKKTKKKVDKIEKMIEE